MTGGPLAAVQVENFRSLRRVNVQLGRLNVLVGPNASGKSNFLDVLAFLGDAARTDLLPALKDRGGYGRVYFRGQTQGPVRIRLEALLTENASSTAPDEYTLEFDVESSQGSLMPAVTRTETFSFKRTAGRGRRITIQGSEVVVADESAAPRTSSIDQSALGLATVKRLGEEQGAEQVRLFTDTLETFRVFEVDVLAARQPSKLGDASIRSDASNLAAVIMAIATDTEVWDEFLRDARVIVPGLEDIIFSSRGGADSAVALELKERGLSGETTLGEASFGTIRGLALLALLYDDNPPAITCIEEIDHGLHPYALDRIVELLREASERTQFLIATHSPIFVNRLRPEELIVCERDEFGASLIPATDPLDVARLRDGGELRLGELWFSGSLGGVPE
jgi:predicted ATPase